MCYPISSISPGVEENRATGECAWDIIGRLFRILNDGQSINSGHQISPLYRCDHSYSTPYINQHSYILRTSEQLSHSPFQRWTQLFTMPRLDLSNATLNRNACTSCHSKAYQEEIPALCCTQHHFQCSCVRARVQNCGMRMGTSKYSHSPGPQKRGK